MELKTYRAATMSEALALVRRHLGPDAAVLHTREVRTSRLFGLVSGPRVIEITASRSVNVPSRLAGREQPAASPAGNATPAAYVQPRRPAPKADIGAPLRQLQPMPDLQAQLAELQTMVKQLCKRSAGDMPEGLFRLFTRLIDADVTEDLARELVARVRRQAAGDLDDEQISMADVARTIEGMVRTSGPISVTPGRCRVAALVGPTGVGKTTTIAKLAANYRLKEKRRVGLITVDTYRIAAVEQLRTYANIINLPMHVVSTPKEMREAVRQMSGMDLVLIDTAGRSPRDEIRLQELRAFINEASADEVHLVLSSVTASRTLEQTAERFAAVGITALVFTKLDEANGLGHLLSVVRSSGLPLSYLTNGQNVPDDIEVADAARLSMLILGMQSACKMAAR